VAPDIVVRRADAGELGAAASVWHAANTARGRPPSPGRAERVRQKLADPAALVLVAVTADGPCGMVLAEPGRAHDGRGPLRPDLCHLSMLFVHPRHQARGLGRLLLAALLREAAAGGQDLVRVWTGSANTAARNAYRAVGFRPTGRTSVLDGGYAIEQWAAATAPHR
jgi:ribosomal protein S18 acetylase RimI-like enzyme